MSLATRLAAFAQAVGADIKALNSKIPYKGDWNAATVYKKGDLVWYSNELWMAITTISGAGDYPDSDYPSVWRQLTEGMSLGGDTGQILAKNSDFSFDTTWIDPSSIAMAGSFYKVVKPTADWGIPAASTAVPGLTVTVPESGNYSVTFTADLNTYPGNGYVIASIAKNGVAVVGQDAAVKQVYSTDPAERWPFNKHWLIPAVAGDVITIVMLNGGSVSNSISAAHTSMIVFRPGGSKGDKGDVGGNATVPIDPWHIVGAVGEPAFLNGWSTTSNQSGLMFRKDPLGRVWVVGAAAGGAPNTFGFILPPGYRPFVANPVSVYDALLDNGIAGGYVAINRTTGEVQLSRGTSANIYVDLSFDTGLVTAMPTGPKGDPGAIGPMGSIPVYEQLTEPVTDEIGAIWIKGD